MKMQVLVVVAFAVSAVVDLTVCAQPPNYGHDFVTVGAPQNRPANQQEAPGLNGWPIGRVDHFYRISRTEVTVSQWYEFVVAFAPYWQGSPGSSALTSDWISYRNGSYVIQAGAENYSANMSWHNAARYCNWLHNGKVNERWAFENGAYDTSTFTTNPNGTRNDQLAHNPGALFWIPTLDEWTKAVYYDPKRYGPGLEGYWLYPDRTNTQLIPGHPWQGGETNAGIPGLYPGQYDIGSYPHVPSPWGLLDASGGVREWTETVSNTTSRSRYVRGTYAGVPSMTFDRLDFISIFSPQSSFNGFRIASVVPSPSTCVVGLLMFISLRRRRSQ